MYVYTKELFWQCVFWTNQIHTEMHFIELFEIYIILPAPCSQYSLKPTDISSSVNTYHMKNMYHSAYTLYNKDLLATLSTTNDQVIC